MPRKKLPPKATENLLVQMMNDMNTKLHQIHKDVTKNKQDIAKLQNDVSFGKGGVRVFVWIVGLIAALIGYFNWK